CWCPMGVDGPGASTELPPPPPPPAPVDGGAGNVGTDDAAPAGGAAPVSGTSAPTASGGAPPAAPAAPPPPKDTFAPAKSPAPTPAELQKKLDENHKELMKSLDSSDPVKSHFAFTQTLLDRSDLLKQAETQKGPTQDLYKKQRQQIEEMAAQK